MKRKNFQFMVILLSFILAINTSYTFANTGRFAILMFGGAKSGPGKKEFDNEPFVQYEIAPMFENLVDPNKYAFDNDDIYVFNLTGDTIDSYYGHFNTNVQNYFEADSQYIISKFRSLNDSLNLYTQNLVFIYISGHQGKGPSGEINYYRLYDYDITDADFAKWIKNDLLNFTYNVKSKSRVVIVAGFCAPWKFVDPEIKDVCKFLTYAVADTENAMSSIRTSADHSFMKYYSDQMNGTSRTFYSAFGLAKEEMLEYYTESPPTPPRWSTIEDMPFRGVKGGTWDTEWSLNGDVIAPDAPTNLSISNSNNHPRLDWDENSEPDLKEYDIWRYSTANEPIWREIASTSNNYWTDNGVGTLDPAERIYYKLKAVDYANNKSSFSDDAYIDGYVIEKPIPSEKIVQKIPEKYQLKTYPNPFNPVAQIQFDLPEASHVNIVIYNIEGKIVSSLANRRFKAGSYTYIFDGSRLSSGIYFCRIQAGAFSAIRQMLFIK